MRKSPQETHPTSLTLDNAPGYRSRRCCHRAADRQREEIPRGVAHKVGESLNVAAAIVHETQIRNLLIDVLHLSRGVVGVSIIHSRLVGNDQSHKGATANAGVSLLAIQEVLREVLDGAQNRGQIETLLICDGNKGLSKVTTTRLIINLHCACVVTFHC